MVLLIAVAVLADVVAPHSPIEQFREHFLTPPVWQDGGSIAFPLGTDDVGRDMLSRLIYGARLSLLIGIAVVTLSLAAASCSASPPAFAGGMVDTSIMRLMDIVLVFPSLLLAIVIVAILGPGAVQRHDRGRHRHAAELHAADARRRTVRTGARLRHRHALRRRRHAAPDVRHRAAQLHWRR